MAWWRWTRPAASRAVCGAFSKVVTDGSWEKPSRVILTDTMPGGGGEADFGKEGADMILEQFYLGCLAHASYLIGSEGVAAVGDPRRDGDIYMDAGAGLGLKIERVLETHLRADFVSGHGELAARTGATIYLGKGSGATFPHRAVEIGRASCRDGV